jgi:hypothetical protein
MSRPPRTDIGLDAQRVLGNGRVVRLRDNELRESKSLNGLSSVAIAAHG